VVEVEPYRHLVAQETYVLRPAAGNKTRLIAGRLPRLLRFAVLHVPGADLALHGFDFFVSDPLHHYMYMENRECLPGSRHVRKESTAMPTLMRRPPPWSPWRPRVDGARPAVVVRPRPVVVAGIKAFHTLAWASIESCVLYVLYAGLRGRTDRRAGIAGTIVAGEVLVFAGNGFRCPLTELAERYGAQSGSVTDIYLPKWFAHNMPAIHAPLLVLMTYLHARNLRRPRQAAEKGTRRETICDPA
jgi:hypothetical protein